MRRGARPALSRKRRRGRAAGQDLRDLSAAAVQRARANWAKRRVCSTGRGQLAGDEAIHRNASGPVVSTVTRTREPAPRRSKLCVLEIYSSKHWRCLALLVDRPWLVRSGPARRERLTIALGFGVGRAIREAACRTLEAQEVPDLHHITPGPIAVLGLE